MSRIPAERKLRWYALSTHGADFLLLATLFAVGLSYGLGYKLDWSEENGRPEDEAEVAEIPAPAASTMEAPAIPATPRPPSLPPEAARTVAASGDETGSPTEEIPAAETPKRPRRDPAWDKMTASLDTLASQYSGRVSIFLKDLRSGRTWVYDPDDLYPAASLIKVPIMIAAFYKIKDGQMKIDEPMIISRRNRVGGSGSLKWRPDGTTLTIRELLVYMINESDNTATKMVLDRLGIDYVQQQFPRMGLLYTGIYNEGMSIKGGRIAHENYTTAREMEGLLEKIYKGEAVDKISSEMMLDILKKPKAVASRLAKGMPTGWEIAHKTGLLRQACHDSAIFLTPNGDYAITVLTGGNKSYSQAKTLITKLAHITFDKYGGPAYLAKATPAKRRRR